ncbi:hypothetical protein IT401_01705, partial [Candidatus Nomurabacteria bacterium]|nr:hypothetical protein [Candidatus Nomurabacteria bacterium]
MSKNYAPVLSALVDAPATTVVSEKHIRALLSLSQEELDRQFGFRTLHSLTNAFVSVA